MPLVDDDGMNLNIAIIALIKLKVGLNKHLQEQIEDKLICHYLDFC